MCALCFRREREEERGEEKKRTMTRKVKEILTFITTVTNQVISHGREVFWKSIRDEHRTHYET